MRNRILGALLVLCTFFAGVGLAGNAAVERGIDDAFRGHLDMSGAAPGQAPVKQADGSWKPAAIVTLSNQNANSVFAGPNGGGAGAPSFRVLVAADIPTNLTLTTAAQPNITSLGTLTGLTMGGTLTVGANTLSLASSTVSGTPTWSSSQAITLSTAAQPNVTSLGTLTSLTMGGTLTVGANTLALASSTVSGQPTWSSAQTFPSIVLSSTGTLSWTSRAIVSSPADSQVLVTDAAGTAFSRMMFGGTTSSYPALRRTGAVLDIVVGDGTAFAVGNALAWQLSNGSKLSGATDGIIMLSDSTAASFTRLQFGGTTSSFPALRRTSAALDCVTADNAAYATFNCNVVAVGNGSAGSPSITMINNTNRGFFNDTTNTGIGFTVGGTQVAVLTGTQFQLLSSAILATTAGTAANPSLTFATASNRGLYDDTGNSGIGFSVGGAQFATMAGSTFQLMGTRTMQVGGDILLTGVNSTHGESGQIRSNSELLTLSTSGTTTDTTANLLPVGAIILAVECRITTTITTATNWSVGDATTAARFSAANSTLTSGTTSTGLEQFGGSGAAGAKQNAAAKVRITTTGTPGAGVIRITVYYWQFTAPTS